MWVEGGESDASLLQAAAGDAVECRTVGAKLVLPTDLFSPRFRQFFETAGQPGAAAVGADE
jgi:hypothetical protein